MNVHFSSNSNMANPRLISLVDFGVAIGPERPNPNHAVPNAYNVKEGRKEGATNTRVYQLQSWNVEDYEVQVISSSSLLTNEIVNIYVAVSICHKTRKGATYFLTTVYTPSAPWNQYIRQQTAPAPH